MEHKAEHQSLYEFLHKKIKTNNCFTWLSYQEGLDQNLQKMPLQVWPVFCWPVVQLRATVTEAPAVDTKAPFGGPFLDYSLWQQHKSYCSSCRILSQAVKKRYKSNQLYEILIMSISMTNIYKIFRTVHPRQKRHHPCQNLCWL